MTCAEFQKVLPYIIETGGNTEEDLHLRECPICSDLIQDLRYIAEQAKLLVPMEDPAPKVWDGIKGSLEREGMIKPARARGRLLGPLTWIGTLAVIIVIACSIFLVERTRQRKTTAEGDEASAVQTVAVSAPAAGSETDDQQLLQHVSAARPDSREAYEENLKAVNASITDAKQRLQQQPADADARRALEQAYQQKAMMYELAIRSLR